MERYLRVNMLGPGPSSYKKKNFSGRGLTKVEKLWPRGGADQENPILMSEIEPRFVGRSARSKEFRSDVTKPR
jgi:hypothetical protein